MRRLLRFAPLLALAACLDSTAPGSNFGSDPSQETFAPALGINLAQMTKIDIPEVQRALWYSDVAPTDTGQMVALGDTITVHYTLWLKDGTKIQSSRDGTQAPIKMLLSRELILGWLIGLPGARAGTVRKLVIPSVLGYGGAGNASIPPHSTLIFDIEVLRVGKPHGSDPSTENFAASLNVNLAQMTKVEVTDIPRAVWRSDLATTDTGTVVASRDTITVHYTLSLRNGTKLHDSRAAGESLTAALPTLIRGWQVGLLGMKAGGTRRLVVPSALAYGSAGSGPVPPHSTLIFDVELLRVGKAP